MRASIALENPAVFVLEPIIFQEKKHIDLRALAS